MAISLKKKATDTLVDSILPKVQTVSTVDESHQCSQCLNLLIRPIQMTCGHRIDKKCFDSYMKTAAQEKERCCPKCGEEIEEVAYKDNSALREILRLQVYCVNRDLGCPWNGQIHQLEEHMPGCRAAGGVQPCPWSSIVDCSFEGDSAAIQLHYSQRLRDHHLVYITHILTYLSNLQMGERQQENFENALSKAQVSVTQNRDSLLTVSDSLTAIRDFLRSSSINTMDPRSWNTQLKSRLMMAISDSGAREDMTDSKLSDLKAELDILRSQLEFTDILPRGTNYSGPSSLPTKLQLLNIDPKDLENKIARTGSTSRSAQTQLNDLDLKVRLSQSSTIDGKYVWRLDRLQKRVDDAIKGTVSELFTPPLYYGQFGYKFSAKIMLYGDANSEVDSKGKFVALYFVLMSGDFDEVLEWPFPFNIKLSLLDQSTSSQNHVEKTIQAESDALPFAKPIREMSPGVGFPQFVAHDALFNGTYVKDDSVFFKLEIIDNKPVSQNLPTENYFPSGGGGGSNRPNNRRPTPQPQSHPSDDIQAKIGLQR